MTGLSVLTGIWFLAAAAGAYVLAQIRRKKILWDFKLTLLVLVFVLILLARMAVNLYGPFSAGEDGITGLNLIERILDSFIHSFQSFSMDEGYTEYTSVGKNLFEEAYGHSAAQIYGIVISCLNILAPIMGGAILLEVLTGIFPVLKSAMRPWRRKFVFSELNEASVTLAEDLMRDQNYRKVIFWDPAYKKKRHRLPLLIFTDAYPDSSSETKSELWERAKSIGAVCIRKDLQHMRLNRSKSVYYFLMDESEDRNVSAMAELLAGDDEGRLMWPAGEEKGQEGEKRTKVFVFCQSDLSVAMLNSLYADSRNRDQMLVLPVRDCTNTAVNLMYEVPLFTPLLEGGGKPAENRPGEKAAGDGGVTREACGTFVTERDAAGRIGGLVPEKELHVSILGSGEDAEELLKAVFWCGQIGGVQLYIHLLSQGASEMKERLLEHCPELLSASKCRPFSEEQDSRLRIYPHTDSPLCSPPYAVIDWPDREINETLISDYPKEILEKTDYYIIALGEDSRNIYAAVMLKKELARRALHTGKNCHTVIAPAVSDGKLADSVRDTEPAQYDPYLIPFGNTEKRFSCRTIFMTDIIEEALEGEQLYTAKNLARRQQDEYSYWANIARAAHAPYKLFAMGCLTGVRLNVPSSERFLGVQKEIAPDDPAFSWMEHRRWAAFMRSQGFIKPSDAQHERYFAITGAHKDLARKFHNCLVENSLRWKEPADALTDECFRKDADPDVLKRVFSGLDALDLVAVKAYIMSCERTGEEPTAAGWKKMEYRQWDDFCQDAAAKRLLSKWG